MLAIIYGIIFSLSTSAHPLPDQTAIVSDTVKRPTRNKTQVTDTTGRYLEVGKITILGNKRTRKSIILRELSLREGDVVNENDLAYILEKDERKLFNLHLFHTAIIRKLISEEGKLDLYIDVDERWYTFPIPIFELSDRNFNEWWENYDHDLSRVNYGVKLYQHNFRGRNETITLKAQFGFQRQFQLMYRIPYINKKQKQGLIFNLDFIEAKNVADSTINHKLNFLKLRSVIRSTQGIGITYTYRNNFYNHHRIKYEYRRTTIADTLLERNPNYLGTKKKRQQFDALTYEFVSDHRDVFVYPLRGYQFNINIQQSGLGLNKDLKKTDAFINFSGFIPLKNNFFFSNFSHLFLSTSNIPYFNYEAMGYNRIFVRGFEIYVVEGAQFFVNKSTLKKRIFNRVWQIENSILPRFNYFPLAIYLKTYSDVGYVENYPQYAESSINTLFSNKLLAGAGGGIDFVMAYDVVLRFEYTFTNQNQSGFFFHIKKEF